VVELRGDVDMHHVPEVHAALLAECAKHPPALIIDLGDVHYMDSSGVGVLVQVYQKMKAAGGKLRLVRVRDRVRGIIEITRLDQYFEIFESEEEAVRS